MPRRSYHNYRVYIITNKPRGVLYIGVTGGIDDRMERHVSGKGSCQEEVTTTNGCTSSLINQYVLNAIAREKQLKRWQREWKINLIEKSNPNWENLWKPLM